MSERVTKRCCYLLANTIQQLVKLIAHSARALVLQSVLHAAVRAGTVEQLQKGESNLRAVLAGVCRISAGSAQYRAQQMHAALLVLERAGDGRRQTKPIEAANKHAAKRAFAALRALRIVDRAHTDPFLEVLLALLVELLLRRLLLLLLRLLLDLELLLLPTGSNERRCARVSE